MIVEDNGAWYVVQSVFNDNVVGPFDNREDAERWLRCYHLGQEQIENGVQE